MLPLSPILPLAPIEEPIEEPKDVPIPSVAETAYVAMPESIIKEQTPATIFLKDFIYIPPFKIK
jgi:hypothetical protein